MHTYHFTDTVQMKFKVSKTLLFTIALLPLLAFSCDGNDAGGNGKFHHSTQESIVEMATVVTTEQGTALRLDSHADTPVTPESYNLLNVNSLTQDGKRLLLEYEWKDAQTVTLQRVRAATTKQIVTPTTAAIPDSLGHDPVYVQKAWIAGGYLNVIFRIYYADASRPHAINAVSLNETDSNGRPVVTLCHNAGKDFGAALSYPAYICFQLNGTLANAAAISLKYQWGDSQQPTTVIATANPSMVELSNDCVFF